MTDSEQAFNVAKLLIERAKKRGDNALNFNSSGVTALRDLPPEIASLTGLNMLGLRKTHVADIAPISSLTGLDRLYLSNTPVSDVSPLATLTKLTTLNLDDTLVTDLRPLRSLTKLASNPGFSGLTFKNTPATQTDPRIAEIAEISDNASRANELFAYLENWVPPGETPTPPPKPDPIFETILTDGKLELAADLPSMAEQAEPLKKAVHQRLQASVPDLARAAGNRFPKLASKARVLAELVDRPFADLDLLAIHFEIETLQDHQNRGTEDDLPFSDHILGPLSDVTRTGPGLTLGHEAVDLYIARFHQARENPQPDAEEAAHRALSQAMVDNPTANGPNSIAMENRIAALENPAQRQAGWKTKHKWLVWTLASAANISNVATVGGIAATTLEVAFGVPVSTFVTSNAPLIMDVAASYGAAMFEWFNAIMGPALVEMGALPVKPNTKALTPPKPDTP